MKQEEFARRRKSLVGMLQEGAIVIIANAPEKIRNRDVFYPYRPDSDFYYLTGFGEPESVAVIIPDRQQGEYLLFCRESDTGAEIWNGTRAGLSGACDDFGAEDAFPITDIDDILPGLLENKKRIYYSMGRYQNFDQKLINWVSQVGSMGRSGIHAPDQFLSLSRIIHEMRLYKSEAELELMKKAADISANAHLAAMKVATVGIKEYQIEAELTGAFLAEGSRSPAYPSIVGSGKNACILHYTDNNDVLRDGDLVLVDAGAEYEFYAADITRTYPVNGVFSTEQRQIYEIVLRAQCAAIDQVKPGNSWDNPHSAAVEVITEGLVELGILEGDVEDLIGLEAYRPYFMHRTGHWLGMDVHDVGDYKVGDQWRPLEPGMVTTIEPGLYLSSGIVGLDSRWFDIGVRIEDDVLVTDDGCEVLSHAVPKTISEIEDVMS